MRYAISDVHGCLDTFQSLLRRLRFSRNDTLYLLGDYIDRGPASKGVIQYILDLRSDGYTLHALRGNHEQLMIDGSHDSAAQASWLRNGGRETLASYFADGRTDIPDAHLHFLDALPYFFTSGDYLLVHAGLNFAAPDPLQDKEGLLWERRWYDRIDYDWLGERIIVHGHTPMTRAVLEAQNATIAEQRYQNIDGGCYSSKPGRGYLCAFNLDDRSLLFEPRIDKVQGW